MIEAEISEALIKFGKEYMGRGPVETRTYINDDTIIVRLKGVLARAETQLSKSGEELALVNPPLILNPPINRCAGQFIRVDRNPLEVIDPVDDEWLCYPAKVGPLLILIYFHAKFDDHPVIERFADVDRAFSVFREGMVRSKGATTSTGIVHSYFANILGPPQYRDIHDRPAMVFFNGFFNRGRSWDRCARGRESPVTKCGARNKRPASCCGRSAANAEVRRAWAVTRPGTCR